MTSIKEQADDMKATVAAFQEQTQSNSVLDFVQWYENKLILDEKRNEMRKKQVAK